MKSYVLHLASILVCCFILPTTSLSQQHQWAVSHSFNYWYNSNGSGWYGEEGEGESAAVIDKQNNTYYIYSDNIYHYNGDTSEHTWLGNCTLQNTNNIRVVKLDPRGNCLWQLDTKAHRYSYLNSYGYFDNSICIDDEDNLYVSTDSILLKMNTSGEILWSKTFSLPIMKFSAQSLGVIVILPSSSIKISGLIDSIHIISVDAEGVARSIITLPLDSTSGYLNYISFLGCRYNKISDSYFIRAKAKSYGQVGDSIVDLKGYYTVRVKNGKIVGFKVEPAETLRTIAPLGNGYAEVYLFNKGYVVRALDSNCKPLWSQVVPSPIASYYQTNLIAGNNERVRFLGRFKGMVRVDTTQFTARNPISDPLFVEWDAQGNFVRACDLVNQGAPYDTSHYVNIYNACGNTANDILMDGEVGDTVELRNLRLAMGRESSFLTKAHLLEIENVTAAQVNCPGDSIDVGFIAKDFGNADYTIELSDTANSYNHPSRLGVFRLNSDTNTVRVKLPPTMYAGKQYHLRVVSSDPVTRGYTQVPIIAPKPRPNVRVTAFKPTTFCRGGSVVLRASGARYYKWSTGDTTTMIEVSKTGIYTVAGIDSNSCEAEDSISVTVVEPPVPMISTLTGSKGFCSGDSLRLIAKTAASYLWSTGATTNAIYVSKPGNYYVTVSNQLGCDSTSPIFTVEEYPLPETPTITFSNDTLHSSAAKNSIWFYNGKQIPRESLPWLVPEESGNYQVLVKSANGCESPLSEPFVYSLSSVNQQKVSDDLLVLPNPSRDIIMVQLPPTTGGRLMIYDELGIQRYAQSIEASGVHPLTFDLAGLHLSSGSYVLVLNANGKEQKRNFTVVR